MATMLHAESETKRATSAFVVLNPKSGRCDGGEARRALERHLAVAGVACRVHEPTHGESLIERVREAVASGCDLVVAAGGDGTVSAVADALAGTETPLGIIPLGTANVLAGELGIPLDLDGACRLLAGDHALARIDAMGVGGQALRHPGRRRARRGDDPRHPRRAQAAVRPGRLPLDRRDAGCSAFQPRRFTLTVDGATTRPRARCRCSSPTAAPSAAARSAGGPTSAPTTAGSTSASSARGPSLDFLTLGWHFLLGQHRRSPERDATCRPRGTSPSPPGGRCPSRPTARSSARRR